MIQCSQAEFITRFSMLSRLQRVAAYCLRFTYNAKNQSLTIQDGRHAKHRQNGRFASYTPWKVFILYNATSQF
jgi:hypothetical protein